MSEIAETFVIVEGRQLNATCVILFQRCYCHIIIDETALAEFVFHA